MSFLDNLENNLKALENQEERDPEKVKREQDRREADRLAAIARAPHLEELQNSPFTSELLTHCRAIGRTQRVLVQFTWLGETLRLDAKTKRMELTPTAEGIVANFYLDGDAAGSAEVRTQSDDAGALAARWLSES